MPSVSQPVAKGLVLCAFWQLAYKGLVLVLCAFWQLLLASKADYFEGFVLYKGLLLVTS